MKSPVWFQLSTGGGDPYMETTVDAVLLNPGIMVFQFRDAVKAKYDQPGYLKDIPAGALIVYKNKAAFDKRNDSEQKGEPLEEDSLIDGLGASKNEALIVVVPSSTSISKRLRTSSHSSISSQDGPDDRRLKRWNELNDNFAQAKITNKDGSTPFSSITWPIVEDALGPVYVQYDQDVRPIPAVHFDVLFGWLSTIFKCFGAKWTGPGSNNEAKRVHLIAPIIWVVVSILDGVTVKVERTIRGRRIKANGKFEFMLERQNKRICIVEAKKMDIEQGIAQDLVGCEVVADLDDSHEVYGIVTTFEKWIFLKCLDDRILFDESANLSFESNGDPHRDQLLKVVGKIHALLM